ncbi:uncharacterized protein LOC143451320 [Clavelina lepadiformis]|uniref:uncharacterized protein LOC143451320 n=1 Tax=Clavelina lepadiformis TaxID=159417 RepID=UPI004041091D
MNFATALYKSPVSKEHLKSEPFEGKHNSAHGVTNANPWKITSQPENEKRFSKKSPINFSQGEKSTRKRVSSNATEESDELSRLTGHTLSSTVSESKNKLLANGNEDGSGRCFRISDLEKATLWKGEKTIAEKEITRTCSLNVGRKISDATKENNKACVLLKDVQLTLEPHLESLPGSLKPFIPPKPKIYSNPLSCTGNKNLAPYSKQNKHRIVNQNNSVPVHDKSFQQAPTFSSNKNLSRTSPVFQQSISIRATNEVNIVNDSRHNSCETTFIKENICGCLHSQNKPATSRDYFDNTSSLKRFHTLPASLSRRLACKAADEKMDLQKNTSKCENQESTKKKYSLKKPPKIASKPKLKISRENDNKEASDNINYELRNVAPHDSSLASVSEIRLKFQEMKIKFEKPIPDPVFTPPPTAKSPKPTANKLFKDILKLNSLDEVDGSKAQHASDLVTERYVKHDRKLGAATEQEERNAPHVTKSSASNVFLNLEKQEVSEHAHLSRDIKNMKAKYESEFESKLINSLISPTEKKHFFKNVKSQVPPKPKHVRSASIDSVPQLTKEISPSFSSTAESTENEILPPPPPPPSSQDFDLSEKINYRDLPDPPDLVESPGQIRDDVDARSTATKLQKNFKSDNGFVSSINSVSDDTVLCQTIRRFASGADYEADSFALASVSHRYAVENVLSPPLISDGFASNEACHTDEREITGIVVAGSTNSNPDQRSASASNERSVGRSSVKSVQLPGIKHTNFSELNSLNDAGSGKIRVENSIKHAADQVKVQSIDEEFLYYDNMDIMEKAKQKRDQKSSRVTQFNTSQFFNTPDGRVQNVDNRSQQGLNYSGATNEVPSSYKSMQVNKSGRPTNGEVEFQHAIGNLEKEYLKLKANLDQKPVVSSNLPGPPKLPPKQLKFNRKSAEQSAETQNSPVRERRSPESVNYQQIRKEEDKQTVSPPFSLNALVVDQKQNNSTSPVPSSPIIGSPVGQSSTSSLNLMTRQISVEDARARQLVDEPLAPIIEEDSTFGDSSSCASSVTGDDALSCTEVSTATSVGFTQTNTDVTLFLEKASSNKFKNIFSERLDRDRIGGHRIDVNNRAHAVNESVSGAVESGSISDDESDASFIRWQTNPIVSTQTEEDKQLHNRRNQRNDDDIKSIHSIRGFRREISWESKGSESSVGESSVGTSADSLRSPQTIEDLHESNELIHDVEPYGMVDLTKLQPAFEEIKVHKSIAEQKLTASSIMSSVREFNSSLGTSSSKPKSDDLDGVDMPNFPLDFAMKNRGKASTVRSKLLPMTPSSHQRSNSDAGQSFFYSDENEEVGYDNLENYGGTARKAAEESRAKCVPSKKPTSNEQRALSNRRLHENSGSRDSLNSSPGLASQTAGSRGSFPLPVSESRLARHSSAVQALDRHSGNLKRAKESARLEILTKSPSSQKIDTYQQKPQSHSSTLPRSRSNDGDDAFERSVTLQHTSRSPEHFDRQRIKSTDRSYNCQKKGKETYHLARANSASELPLSRSSSVEGDPKTIEPNSKFREVQKSPIGDHSYLLASPKNINVIQPTQRSKSDNQKNHPQQNTGTSNPITSSINQVSTNYQPFSFVESDYEECLDEGVINPYEEVPFVPGNALQRNFVPVRSLSETEEQLEAKSRVQEILENIKPPETSYKPKPPVPRYPVEYDNFYLGTSARLKAPEESENQTTEAESLKLRHKGFSPPPFVSSPTAENKLRFQSNSNNATLTTVSPVSFPFATELVERSGEVTNQEALNSENITIENSKTQSAEAPRRKSCSQSVDDLSCDSPDASVNSNRSLGSQLKSLLSGNTDNKYISPSLRRKRSLLKRSKSPGGSRRSKTPPRSKSPNKSEEEKSSESREIDTTSVASTENKDKSNIRSLKSDVEETHDNPPRRSASQRLVERRGRKTSHEDKSSSRKSLASEPEDDQSNQTLQRSRKNSTDKSRMSSRWRRSKSHDRSPTRSKSKERKLFGKRSKSQERPEPKSLETKEIDVEDDEQKGGKSIFRRSRSSSRKRDRRSRSSERKEDGNSNGNRGRNPVKFFRKLLRNKKESDEEESKTAQTPQGNGAGLTESTEALDTILAYKGEGDSKDSWTPPRPNPPQQHASNTFSKSLSGKVPAKNSKVMKSPPSHRAKKMSSALTARSQLDYSAESSSDTHEKRRDSSRRIVGSPQKPVRSSSRKSSYSNSIPSSDSERLGKREETSTKDGLDIAALNSILRSGKNFRKGKLRRNVLLNREYDSDTATSSVLPSDADSSNDVLSDVETGGPTLRPALKRSQQLAGSKAKLTPRRPVRVISPRRSKSDPTIFPEKRENADTKNTYYNFDDEVETKSTQQQEKKTLKQVAQRRRNQKQARRQTAPVDLAYATHQRQKYKTLVSLNAQTLRKVTERWLSEWRNKLPVGGFLITSWSDIALASHRPLCMIGNSVVYSAVSTGSNAFNLACQLYDQRDVDDRMLRQLDNCASLPAHPNTCGVCSHFSCRVPRSLLDPNSGGGAADTICVVLSSRPIQSLQEYLDRIFNNEDTTEFHKQILVTTLQLLLGMRHLLSSGFNLPQLSTEHLVLTEDRRFLQILPHLGLHESNVKSLWDADKLFDNYQSTDSDSSHNPSSRLSHTQQLGHLIRRFLQSGNLMSTEGHSVDRTSTASAVSRIIVPNTKYSSSIKHLINYLEQSPSVGVQEAAEVVQCALWGPEDLEDVGVDDVSPYAALELWIEMEQAKLVNSLAVLTSNDRLVPFSFLKHQYFAAVGPEVLFKGLKVLQRI